MHNEAEQFEMPGRFPKKRKTHGHMKMTSPFQTQNLSSFLKQGRGVGLLELKTGLPTPRLATLFLPTSDT